MEPRPSLLFAPILLPPQATGGDQVDLTTAFFTVAAVRMWGKVDAREEVKKMDANSTNLEAMVMKLVPSFHKRQHLLKQPRVCSFLILRRASDSSEGWRGRDGNCCRTSDFDDEQFTAGLFR